MDTFIDKLAQKKNAQEMIRANMTAEAERLEQLQSQMKAYDELMQEIRQVNLKTAENAVEVQNTLKEYIARLEVMRQNDDHAVEEQTEDQEQERALEQIKTLLEEKFQQSDDFLHKENVKVYRNVQAALVEELNKQTEEMNKQTEEIRNSQAENRGSKAVLPIAVLILLGVIANIVIQLFSFKIVL